MIRAAELVNISPIVRVTDNAPESILRALDIGAHGVQVPQVSSCTEAEEVLKSARFHPDGNRGVCKFVRAADYSSTPPATYLKEANRQSLVIVHIEGIEGINNLPDILKNVDVDIVFIGPYDLSQSCDVPGQVDHPEVEGKMKEAVALAQEADKIVGTFVDDVETARKWRNLGVQYIAFSVDVGLFSRICSDIVRELSQR